MLTNLMASGYLEPALFNKESNELVAEAENPAAGKGRADALCQWGYGQNRRIAAVAPVYIQRNHDDEFDDAVFLSFVERITVLSRKEVAFELKCGLSLRERLVEIHETHSVWILIENGRAVIDEEQAATVREFFRTIFPAWR